VWTANSPSAIANAFARATGSGSHARGTRQRARQPPARSPIHRERLAREVVTRRRGASNASAR
jgi:hypothetical protein